jgi:hypothetical protein
MMALPLLLRPIRCVPAPVVAVHVLQPLLIPCMHRTFSLTTLPMASVSSATPTPAAVAAVHVNNKKSSPKSPNKIASPKSPNTPNKSHTKTAFDRDDIADVKAQYTARWSAEQSALRDQLIESDRFTWTIRGADDPRSQGKQELQYIGGVDISFVGDDDKRACAALMVLNYPKLEVVYEDYEMVELTQPYIAGFLAFREVINLYHISPCHCLQLIVSSS